MARSSYIYIVIENECNIIGAFTVKHELITWLQSHLIPRFEVKRLRDGRDTTSSKEDITTSKLALWFYKAQKWLSKKGW